MTTTHTARYITPESPEWPEELDDLAEPPAGLWVKGDANLADWSDASIAIVGSRASTAYGNTVAANFANEISNAGHAVISGGAYGIDAAAHRGCLAGSSPTVVVLASGLDVPYPSGHASLFDRVLTSGGLLVSEYGPGEHPTRQRFLARNRLIAALSDVVVVVEAAPRSGALNTANWALALDRTLLAVPGPVTSVTSGGTNALIRGGEADLVTNADDIVSWLN